MELPALQNAPEHSGSDLAREQSLSPTFEEAVWEFDGMEGFPAHILAAMSESTLKSVDEILELREDCSLLLLIPSFSVVPSSD